jgi:hypothetical protein
MVDEEVAVLTKQKVWIGAGVLAAAAGVVVGQGAGLRPLVWPGGGRPATTQPGEIESGEAGQRVAPVVDESGEAGQRQPTPSATSADGAESGEHGASANTTETGDYEGGSFDAALAAVLDGEGGKDGLGISRLLPGAGGFSTRIPTLNAPQVQKAVAGNSLRSERHFAMHFEPDGHYRGWSLSWVKAPMAKCPGKSGPDYGVFDGECWIAKENVLVGRWMVRADALCLDPAPRGVTQGQGCVRAALLLNSLVFFGPDGRMIGKGADLVKGDNAAHARKS